jgi:hypothetical protein
MIVAFVGFSRIFLPGILIFKGLTARHLYKSFGVKGLTRPSKQGINSLPQLSPKNVSYLHFLTCH